jgi:hypothetical protein
MALLGWLEEVPGSGLPEIPAHPGVRYLSISANGIT